MRNNPFEKQTKSFLFSFGQESPKSIQDVFGDVFFPGKYCFERKNCEYLDA